MLQTIPPRSGVAFELRRGQRLRVVDPEGEQVADLLCHNLADTGEALSSGRSLDYAGSILLSTGAALYSNRSRVMLRIVADEVGRHDFLLAPCSAEMFRILHGEPAPHRGCFGNLAAALAPWGIAADDIPTAFNVFMNVRVDGDSGKVRVDPPLGQAGDSTTFAAEMDLVVGLTACASRQSNNGHCKPIHYEVLDGD
jgi:uncharacterized protein YcgI (DUF1989 family)